MSIPAIRAICMYTDVVTQAKVFDLRVILTSFFGVYLGMWRHVFVLFKKWPLLASFVIILGTSMQLIVNKTCQWQFTVDACSLKNAYEWMQTADLWYKKQPLCQLCFTTAHSPPFSNNNLIKKQRLYFSWLRTVLREKRSWPLVEEDIH